MNMNITQNILLAAAVFVTGTVACYADVEMDKQIAMARSAAPAAISDISQLTSCRIEPRQKLPSFGNFFSTHVHWRGDVVNFACIDRYGRPDVPRHHHRQSDMRCMQAQIYHERF